MLPVAATICKPYRLLPELIENLHLLSSRYSVAKYGFAADKETGKLQKVLYHTKIKTLRMNSIVGKHRVVESIDPTKQTTKYLLTDQLTWDAGKILTTYNKRWVIEEFFRNAKQLTDMEGVTIRSE